MDVIILLLSMSGTMANKGPRRFISPFVHMSTILAAVELFLECYGIIVVFGPRKLTPTTPDCEIELPYSTVTLLQMVVIWSFSALVIYFIILSFFFFGSNHKTKFNRDKTVRAWQRRLELCCIGTVPHVADSKDVLREVASELADYFQDVQWAPTDVAAGLILLKREQKRITEIRQARRLIIEKPVGFSIPTVDSSDTLSELALVNQEGLRRRELAVSSRMTIATMTSSQIVSPHTALSGDTGQASGRWAGTIGYSRPDIAPDGQSDGDGLTRVNSRSTISGRTPEPANPTDQSNLGEFAKLLNFKDLSDDAANLIELASTAPPQRERSDTVITVGTAETNHLSPGSPYIGSDLDSLVSGVSSQPSNVPLLNPPAQSLSFPFSLRLGAPGASGNSNNAKFKPWLTRRKTRMGHHRLRPRKNVQRGSVTREEIDDILHFARYAEVIYDDQDIALSINRDRLIRHSPHNDMYKSPYLIVHDSETDSVVLAIRGTYSAADIFVDLKFNSVEFNIPELAEQRANGMTHYAHEGMLMSATNIVNELKELNILDQILKDPSSAYYECGLVVTGHSLGAGVATLIACMLRPNYPTVCCYSFEPPGCLVSAEVAEYLESFCTSVVMGDDLVPRISRNTMQMLKMDVARLIQSCDHPKWKVFGSALGTRICFTSSRLGASKEKMERGGILHRRTPSGRLRPDDLALLRRRTNSLRAGRKSQGGKDLYEDMLLGLGQLPSTPMFIPGRILYIEKFRRPPLGLNEAIGGAIDLAKVRTMAVGGKIMDGAEKIIDGAEGIKDRIMDGAEGIKDRIMDGAEGIKDRIMDGAEGIKGRLGGGRARRDDDDRSSEEEDDVLSPSEAPGAIRKRTGSLGDVLRMTPPKMSRSRSVGDILLSSEDVAKRRQQLQDLQGQGILPSRSMEDDGKGKTLASIDEGAMTEAEMGEGGERSPRKRRAGRRLERGVSVERGLREAAAGGEDDEGNGGAGRRLRKSRSASRHRSRKRGAGRGKRDRAAAGGGGGGALSASETEDEGVLVSPTAGQAGPSGEGPSPRRPRRADRPARHGSNPHHQGYVTDGEDAEQTISPSQRRDPSRKAQRRRSLAASGGGSSSQQTEFPNSYVVPLAGDDDDGGREGDAKAAGREAADKVTEMITTPKRFLRRHNSSSADVLSGSPGTASGSPSGGGNSSSGGSAGHIIGARRSNSGGGGGSGGGSSGGDRHNKPSQLSFSALVRTPSRSNSTPASPGSPSSPEELVLSRPQYPPSYPTKKKGQASAAPAAGKSGGAGRGPPGSALPHQRHGKYHYIPRWATRYEFQEITISRSMVNDHSPFGLLREFQAAPPGSVLGVVTRD
ncbi:hypothetical protein DFJ73DRAFT_554383 [Zopfochytrium polystomum]|nr:hypothetical protein DFJ73DRAFT_554383 [Zopfochytrium polystomum]